jgi:aspartate-semialdehyde dehydrogenase
VNAGVKTMKAKNIAIVGATGAVGQEAVKVLEKSDIKPASLRLFASKRSAGKKISFRGDFIEVEELKEDSFKEIDIAIFSIGANLSKKYTEEAVKQSCIVIDNSSAFRMDNDVPLIIPEINEKQIHNHKGIIANPNCTTIISLMAVYPIYKLSKISEMTIASYQAVSGAGLKAMYELEAQLKAYSETKYMKVSAFRHQIALNVFSHDSEILDNGYNKEEQKAIDESRKILNDSSIKISPTCVRVPVMRSHSVAISLITEKQLDLEEIKQEIESQNGVSLLDDRINNHFPMPIESSNKYDVFIGRLRRGMRHNNEIMLFACGDQLLKGAALNAVQIMEKLI